MTHVQFRTFIESDLSELKPMIMALYAEDADGEPMSSEKIQRTVQELMSHPNKGQIIVFCMDDAVVGYAILLYVWSNEYGGNLVTVDELYVKRPWRGQGIGTAFLRSIGPSDGVLVKGVRLEVTPTNERALAYYLRQGFEPVANRHLLKKLGPGTR